MSSHSESKRNSLGDIKSLWFTVTTLRPSSLSKKRAEARAPAAAHRSRHAERARTAQAGHRIDADLNLSFDQRAAHRSSELGVGEQQLAIGLELIGFVVRRAVGQIELAGRHLRGVRRVDRRMTASCTCG